MAKREACVINISDKYYCSNIVEIIVEPSPFILSPTIIIDAQIITSTSPRCQRLTRVARMTTYGVNELMLIIN